MSYPEFESGERIDRELENVTRFQEVLSNISHIEPQVVKLDIYEQTESDPVNVAKERFASYGSHGTLYLENRYLRFAGEEASFEPRITRGGKRSAHGVVFGDLNIGEEEPVPVAVKPHKFEGAVDSCLGEYYNNEMVRQLGLPNLEAVGFVVSSGNEAYSMTRIDDTLSTIDAIDWSDFYPDMAKDPGMQEIWRQVSYQAAILHSHGNMSHGDFAARNIAVTIDGGVFLIDWEKAYLNMTPPRDAEARYARSHGDLSMLMESMCRPTHDDFKAGIGLFYGKEADWWQGFREIFFDTYRHVRLELATEGNHHKQTENDVREELHVLDQSLLEDMSMMRDVCSMIPPKTT